MYLTVNIVKVLKTPTGPYCAYMKNNKIKIEDIADIFEFDYGSFTDSDIKYLNACQSIMDHDEYLIITPK